MCTPPILAIACSDSGSAHAATTAILYTIFFHRVFSPVAPVSPQRYASFGANTHIPYPAISENDELDSHISQTVQVLVQFLTSQNANNSTKSKALRSSTTGTILIRFYEKLNINTNTNTNTNTNVNTGEKEKVKQSPWEEWVVSISLNDKDPRENVANQLSEALLQIVSYVNSSSVSLPPITSTVGNPFPYCLVVPSYEDVSIDKEGIISNSNSNSNSTSNENSISSITVLDSQSISSTDFINCPEIQGNTFVIGTALLGNHREYNSNSWGNIIKKLVA